MKAVTMGQLGLLVFAPLLLLPIIIVILKIFQVIVGRFVQMSEKTMESLDKQKAGKKEIIAGHIMNTCPSEVARFLIEITVGLILFSTFGRMFSLPLYLYVAARWDLPEPIETFIAVVLSIVAVAFAVLAAVKLLKIVHKHLLT
jgi:hypothetical protein